MMAVDVSVMIVKVGLRRRKTHVSTPNSLKCGPWQWSR